MTGSSLETVASWAGILGIGVVPAIGWIYQCSEKKKARRDLEKWKLDVLARLSDQSKDLCSDMMELSSNGEVRATISLYKYLNRNIRQAKAITDHNSIIAVPWGVVRESVSALEIQVGNLSARRGFDPAAFRLSCGSIHNVLCAAKEKFHQMGV